MQDFELLSVEQWKPLQSFGFTSPFFNINKESIINAWIMIGLLLIILLILRIILRRKGIGRFLTLSFIKSFIDLIKQALGNCPRSHFYFVTTLFVFILFSNLLALIPLLEEPTKDLGTTLALGIISFIYTQYAAIKKHGIRAYIKEYFAPFFIMFPLHLMGKLANIISLAFRLFGNIFGGATITKLYTSFIKSSAILEIFGIASGMNLTMSIFFVLFEGFLQAFVFTMLTVTYLSIALQGEEETGEAHG